MSQAAHRRDDAPQPEMPLKLKMRLFPAVLELFSQNDFHQVNMRAISSLSGLGVSTIYRYYPSKEALVFGVLDEKIGEIAPLIAEHVQGLESTREIMRKVFWVTMNFYDRNPGVAVTAFITVPMRSWMREMTYRRPDANNMFEQLLEYGRARGELDPELTYSQLQDMYYMVCHRWIHRWHLRGGREPLVDSMDRFFGLFWKAVSP